MSISCYEIDFCYDGRITIDDVLDELGVDYSIICFQLIRNDPKTYRYWVLLKDGDYARVKGLIDNGDFIVNAV